MRARACAQVVEADILLDGGVKESPMLARTTLGLKGVDAAGAEQAAETAEPGQTAQDGAEVPGVLDLVQVNGLAGRRRRAGADRRHRHYRDDSLRGLGVGDLRHLPVTDQVRPERALPVLVGGRDVEFAARQQGRVLRRFLQFQHQVFALDEEVAELLPVLFLLQFLDVVEFHGRPGKGRESGAPRGSEAARLYLPPRGLSGCRAGRREPEGCDGLYSRQLCSPGHHAGGLPSWN